MKRYLITFVLFFAITMGYGQFSEEEKKILYPTNYTFEQAEVFENEGNYDKAMWFYINLYPENREKVIEKIKHFKEKHDTIDLRSFIINSFSTYSVFDPSISNWKNGYPELNKEKLDIKGSWGDALIAEFYKEDYSKKDIVPIKTKAGFLIVFNYENAKFTLRIEGKDAKLTDRFMSFIIDNKILGITIANVSDVSNFENCKNMKDSLIVHKNYELNYLSKMIGEKLNVKKEESLNASGTELLLWYYLLPPKLNAELVKQYIGTTIIGDKILMLYTASEKKEKYKSQKDYLMKFISTIKVYNETIDVDKIIESVKNE